MDQNIDPPQLCCNFILEEMKRLSLPQKINYKNVSSTKKDQYNITLIRQEKKNL